MRVPPRIHIHIRSRLLLFLGVLAVVASLLLAFRGSRIPALLLITLGFLLFSMCLGVRPRIVIHPVYATEIESRLGEVTTLVRNAQREVLGTLTGALNRSGDLVRLFGDVTGDRDCLKALLACDLFLSDGSSHEDCVDLCNCLTNAELTHGARYQLAVYFSRLGIAARQRGALEQAAELFQQGIEQIVHLPPMRVTSNLFFSLGAALERQEELAAAIAAYTRSAHLDELLGQKTTAQGTMRRVQALQNRKKTLSLPEPLLGKKTVEFFHYTNAAGFSALTEDSKIDWLPSIGPRPQLASAKSKPLGASEWTSDCLHDVTSSAGHVITTTVLLAARFGLGALANLEPLAKAAHAKLPKPTIDRDYGPGWYATDLPPTTDTSTLLHELWLGSPGSSDKTEYWLLLLAESERLRKPDSARPHVMFISLLDATVLVEDEKAVVYVRSTSPVYLIAAGKRTSDAPERSEELYRPSRPKLLLSSFCCSVSIGELDFITRLNLKSFFGLQALP